MSNLTEYMVRTAEFKSRKYTLSDGRGLILEVNPAGAKYWIVRIYKNCKEIRRGIGTYPEISLKEARKRAFELKNYENDNKKSKLTFSECYELYNEKRGANLAASTRKARDLRFASILGHTLAICVCRR